tara:strand:- start:5633 stop:7087 length:1455 start_codon:yes stop_codon:yes gene_type:complete
MVKNLSYRDKLLELASIYKVSDIQDYIKRKKHLTTSQIEHILKKNNVPLPVEVYTTYFDRNISKPLTKLESKARNILLDFFVLLWKKLGKIGLNFLNVFPKVLPVVSTFLRKIFYDLFSSIYNPTIEVKKANQIVKVFGIFIVVVAIGVIFMTLKENYNEPKLVKNKAIEKKQVDKKAQAPKDQKKQLEIKKKIEKDKSAKKAETKKTPPIKEKDPSQVTALVLPNLNLKTQTVLNLFDDVEYDLKKVRFKKKVKPIYFTQFPKDLDEIKDVQLKKDTFIKIVLPLVIAENDKILDDRYKLTKILSRKITTDKEKLWLRQKLREYKVKNSDMKELKIRMDMIPVSIALAQAAKESGWGTSRFALEGNAIFGQWTWTGKGIEPLNKGKNEGHKILRFPILRASVKAYKNNLNTHKVYSEFRAKRFNLRKSKKELRGISLANTLDKYAQTGKEYTEIINQIIKQNKLGDFETVQLTNSVTRQELKL